MRVLGGGGGGGGCAFCAAPSAAPPSGTFIVAISGLSVPTSVDERAVLLTTALPLPEPDAAVGCPEILAVAAAAAARAARTVFRVVLKLLGLRQDAACAVSSSTSSSPSLHKCINTSLTSYDTRKHVLLRGDICAYGWQPARTRAKVVARSGGGLQAGSVEDCLGLRERCVVAAKQADQLVVMSRHGRVRRYSEQECTGCG